MKRNEDGDTRPSLEEREELSFSELGEARITRSRAIKLAGAALAGSALSLFWATDKADARNKKKRRRRKRRRRRQRQVTATPNPVQITTPGTAQDVTVTNNGPDTVVIDPRLVNADGFELDLSDLTLADLTLEAGESVDIPVLVNDPLLLVDGEGLLEIRDASVGGIFENLLLEVIELDALDLLPDPL